MFSFLRSNVKTVSAMELDHLLPSISLIDVREDAECRQRKIKQAKNIPMNELLKQPEKYLTKEQEYYIICQSGGRSERTCSLLEKQGYQVVNVVGGMSGYRGQNEK